MQSWLELGVLFRTHPGCWQNFLLLWDQGPFLWLAVSGVLRLLVSLSQLGSFTFSKPEGECPFSLLIIIQYHCRSDGPFVFVICQQSDRPLPSQAPATLEGREFLQGVCTSRWESWGGVIIESAYYCLNAN